MTETFYMRKIMKSSAIKTVVVSLTADNVSEFEINSDIFDDPFLEAATRAVEKCRKVKGAIIRPITTCWDKKTPKKTYMYNSYWILVNAGCYAKAEQLREKFKIQHDVDLKNEPLHGRDSGPK
jgi:hypothetical protein